MKSPPQLPLRASTEPATPVLMYFASVKNGDEYTRSGDTPEEAAAACQSAYEEYHCEVCDFSDMVIFAATAKGTIKTVVEFE